MIFKLIYTVVRLIPKHLVPTEHRLSMRIPPHHPSLLVLSLLVSNLLVPNLLVPCLLVPCLLLFLVRPHRFHLVLMFPQATLDETHRLTTITRLVGFEV